MEKDEYEKNKFFLCTVENFDLERRLRKKDIPYIHEY